MPTITLYSTRTCPYCVQAENLLARKGLSVSKILVDSDQAEFANMVERSGRRSVPQIFIGERHVGGFTDLLALDLSGELSQWLANAAPAQTTP
ncbi:glutaredoxin 3 [Chitinilyticum piscinae]|uniref:Glutaredoxin n=1 Tax=Chitinilyticum piscinae TaxID=2866724 RepID=A0A8J7FKQ8_9NEIS|nr:glutaredoxin 3 [Chitinilyticum piscinae]MBE9609537.1 glutaredoxin 3 [Chitinilyticum piscinae]